MLSNLNYYIFVLFDQREIRFIIFVVCCWFTRNPTQIARYGACLLYTSLGTDVEPETYIKTAVEQNCQIICCSALLTTTMGVMEDVIKKADEAKIRYRIKIMVGGAPVTQAFCEKIGADYYTPDATTAADVAAEICQKMAMGA